MLFVLALAGCGGVVYERDPHTGKFVETHRFSRQEDIIYISIDSALAEEKAGKSPSGGFKTWRESWQSSVAAWRRYGNLQYEEYFRRRRKEMELNDLKNL
jgi:hypothetical protein